MITINVNTRYRQTVERLGRMPEWVFRSLMVGFHQIGELAEKRVKSSMDNTMKAPWTYFYAGANRRPSLPFFPPAKQTGTLYDAIQQVYTERYTASFSYYGEVSIGPDFTPEAYYAKYLEHGTKKMIERPFMKPAYRAIKPEISTILRRRIREALRRLRSTQ